MKQETLDFLTNSGYLIWNSKEDVDYTKKEFQKRVKDSEGYPLCLHNENLRINLTYYSMQFVNGGVSEGFEIYVVHERKGEEWCDFKIYSLTEDQILNKLAAYEHTLLEAWKVFYETSEVSEYER